MDAATSGVFLADEAVAAASGELGTASGFMAFYRAHAPFTWTCLRRLGVPPASIDDAMQEVWVTAHRRLDSLRAPGAAKSWLYGIARRVASHQRRTEGRHRHKLDAWGDTAPTHERAERESSMIVEAMLASLDERVREAFVLSELEGWTAPEIAQATGANANTIYWRVRTAKQQLQSRLGDRDLEAEVIQLRGAAKPTRKAISHCWLAIAPQLGKAPVLVGVFSAWSAAKLVLLGAGVTVAVATGAEFAMRAPMPTEPSSRAIAVSRDQPPGVLVVDTPRVEAATLPGVEPALVSPEARSRVVSPTLAVGVRAAVTPSPASRAEVAPVPAPRLDVAAHDVTGDDAGLLMAAKQALTDARTDEARRLLREHHDRFEHSKLADVRDAIEVELACRAGDSERARALVAGARSRGLGAATLAKLEATCGGRGGAPQ